MFISTEETKAAEIIDIKVSSSLLTVVLKKGIIYFDACSKAVFICYNAHYEKPGSSVPKINDILKKFVDNGLTDFENKTFVVQNDNAVGILNNKFAPFIRTAIKHKERFIPSEMFLSLCEFDYGIFIRPEQFSFQEILKSDVIEVFNFKS